jgi:hypothetical protein
MSISQLANYYDTSEKLISYYARKFGFNKNVMLENLTEEDIIYMYKSLLKGEIKSFTNGILKNNKYINYIMRYLINEILNWEREEICEKYCGSILNKYKLSGLYACGDYDIYELIDNALPEYSIKRWELKNSSVGNKYWKDENNVNEVLMWLKIKLANYKNIFTINEAGEQGFQNLLEEYNLMGLLITRFDYNSIKLFEKIYKEKYDKNEMIKSRYTFKVNENEIERTLEGNIYKVTNEYYKLDERGKTLINEIIKYCETEKKFPNERDLSKKRGYISRTQFYKYFGENSFESVYKYILPVISYENKQVKIKRT